MKRGDLVSVALAGDYGKPRPALIIQSNAFDLIESVTVLPLTSDLREAPLLRITVRSGEETGLKKVSQVMIDKASTLSRAKIGRRIGSLNGATMQLVAEAMKHFFELE